MDTFKIQSLNSVTSATFVPEYGGICTSMIMPDVITGEREILYLPKDFDPTKLGPISCAWPICFPVCGRLAKGGKHPMEIHGFAHRFNWDIMVHNQDAIALLLLSDHLTREIFPYDFEIIMIYTVRDNLIICEMTIKNTSYEYMPYYAGFHPYFLIDPARYQKSDVKLHAKPKSLYLYNDGLDDIIGKTKPFDFPVNLAEAHINEQLLEMDENVSALHFPDGQVLQMQIDNDKKDNPVMPFLQLYHIPSEPFFCMEPWMSHPNAMNHPDALPMLAPYQKTKITLTLSMSPAL